MPSVLITGANRGIGLELARQYSEDGWQVIATCRHPQGADELKALKVDVRQLDVTDVDGIKKLAQELSDLPVDILFNNAGVMGSREDFGSTDPETWTQTMRINALGPLKMAEAFAPHLERAKGLIANMTSRMGSIGDNSGGSYYSYRASKAALNAHMKSAAIDLAPRNIRVVLLHPGWVQTRMGGPSAQLSTQESARGLRQICASITPDNSGHFYRYDGDEIAW